jgi:AcrR family transcriptional regulator
MADPTPIRRPDAVARTRARGIDAARELFADGGYYEISVEDIAERAGVVRSTIYNLFGSKVALLEAVVHDALRKAGFEGLREAMQREDALDALHGVFAAGCALWASDDVIFRKVIGLASVDEQVRTLIDRLEGARRDDLGRLVNRLAEQGYLREGCSEERAARTLELLASFEAFDHLYSRSKLSVADVAQELWEQAQTIVVPPATAH